MKDRIDRIQSAVRGEGHAAWILFDFHGTNPIARRVLSVGEAPGAPKTTRRWFCVVPAEGEVVKIVHRLEPRALDHLPGRTEIYLTWTELDRALAAAVERLAAGPGSRGAAGAAAGLARPVVAMEYSPAGRLPYVSRVDAGTVELVRRAGADVVSSADLAQRFDGALDPEARADHVRTGVALDGIIRAAFDEARTRIARGAPITESGLQRWILARFDTEGLVSSDPPTVAVNEHSADAHFTNTAATDRTIGAGDFLLLDAWAKRRAPRSVYADYTQVAYFGVAAPPVIRAAFEAVRESRDAAIAHVREGLSRGVPIRGCDVDDAARTVMRDRGFADRFFHRTGHSIGEEVHGNGVHLDNLETRDERRLLEGSLVSVEPGVYLDSFGVRSEVNLMIDGGAVVVTTPPIQNEILLLHG